VKVCYACWAEDGKPSELPENADEIVEMINKLYSLPDGFTGGPIHVVTDDWNVEDENVQGCLFQIDEDLTNGVWSRLTCELARRIGELLLPLTEDQRSAVLAKRDGFIS
jgi:hypothetical protein